MDGVMVNACEQEDFIIEHLQNIHSDSMSSNHYHTNFEIYYLISGERYYFIEDSLYKISEGDLILINANDLHKTLKGSTEKFSRILISFNLNFLKSILEEISDIHPLLCFERKIHILSLTPPQQAIVEHLLHNMLDEYKKHPSGYLTNLRLDLLKLLIFTARFAEKSLITTDHKKLHTEDMNSMHSKILLAVQYINTHYSDDISLKDLSCLYHISYYYFCRVFHQVTGFTLKEYISSVRIRKAQQLLWDTKLSISAISELVGYDDITNFGRVFKQITHLSPLQYRKTKNSKGI
jgi:YesN/AraC family two-component response regulator